MHMHRKFYGDRPRGTPPAGELNTTVVVKYSDFGPIEGLYRKRCKMRGKLVLITYRKSYMTFRLVSKSVTLSDFEGRNDRFCVISATLVAFSAHCVKVVEDIAKLSPTEI